jgi:GTP-binding protein
LYTKAPAAKAPTRDPTMNPEFLTSASCRAQFPRDQGREVAFAGRSNAGKSTALNCLVGRRKLARTSKTPGRTQLVNFFTLDAERRLVDLPGYGYARVPESAREQWRTLVESYFAGRRSLAGLVVTVDIRRGVGELDERMLGFARALEVPVMMLLTKADKLSRAAQARQRELANRVHGEAAEIVAFSALDRTGVELAQARLHQWLELAQRA